MPQCRVKHPKGGKEMPGSRRRMEEHGGLPALPQAPYAPSVSPWARSAGRSSGSLSVGSERNSTPEPIEPPARMSPQAAPVQAPKGYDAEAAAAKRSPANSAFHSAHDLGVRLHTLRREETRNLKAKAVYAKQNPKSVPLWFFEKYKNITNS